jgi:hypothetical protein
MDLKRKVEVGDYVMYLNGEIAIDLYGNPMIVISIERGCVFYPCGGFDYLGNVYPVPLLLKELF